MILYGQLWFSVVTGLASSKAEEAAGFVDLLIVFWAVSMALGITSAVFYKTIRMRFTRFGPLMLSPREVQGSARAYATKHGGGGVLRPWLRSSRRSRRTEGRGEEEVCLTSRHRIPVGGLNVPAVLVATGTAVVAVVITFFLGGTPLHGASPSMYIAGILLAWIGVYIAAGVGRDLEIYIEAASTPTSQASEVSGDLESVELYGSAETIEGVGTHPAPLSGVDCLFCRYEVVETTGRDEVSESGGVGVPFLLEDGSGGVVVDPEDAELEVVPDTDVVVEGLEAPPEEIRDGYVDIGTNDVDARYREWYVQPGEEVYVYGDVGSQTDNTRELSVDGDVVSRRSPDSIFVISDLSEADLRKSLLRDVAARGVAGLSLLAVGMSLLAWVSPVF